LTNKNLSTGTPATVDFLHKFRADFKTNVTEHLDKLSREAMLSQDDPARMRDSTAQRIRKAILNRVYGKRKYCTLNSYVHYRLHISVGDPVPDPEYEIQ
jgi:hypothetical protein